MSTIGARLREERERLGLSQTAFSLLGGVTKHTQIYYEKDERSPTALYLEAAYKAGVDINYIVTGARYVHVSSASSDDLMLVRDYVPDQLKPLFDKFISLWISRTLDPSMIEMWSKMIDGMNPALSRATAETMLADRDQRVANANAALEAHKQDLIASGQAGKVDMSVFSRKPGIK